MSEFNLLRMRGTFPVLAALCGSVFVVGTAEFLTAGLLPEIGSDLGVPVPISGQVVTADALGTLIAAPALIVVTTAAGPGRAGSSIAAAPSALTVANMLGVPLGAALGQGLVLRPPHDWERPAVTATVRKIHD
ncbi:hypothetical protein [Nonomuraea dietziae]|uniref:Putative MFS family arabinose efflux permease n=1 Tax=Nonomuraea dietziae TaxID=65515 RepID=A0A7W5V7Y4_9ACTN|nr:hypothetical protein [Nonomuraea dietziae]MBB3726580.1 putative MFS family arabinose efflux permease [Nonomuraea dietziae]